jgi:hypothetical protein
MHDHLDVLLFAHGLPFFHALTGCDTVSAFRGKSKRTAWGNFDEAIDTFVPLSEIPAAIGDQDIECILAFSFGNTLESPKVLSSLVFNNIPLSQFSTPIPVLCMPCSQCMTTLMFCSLIS